MQGNTPANVLFVVKLDYAMRQAIDGREVYFSIEFGLEIIQRQGRRHPAIQLTYLSYADDIELISQEVEQAQQLLTSIETEVCNIGIQLNSKKTEVMMFNHIIPVNIRIENGGTLINNVTHFKYLGTWIASSQKDFEIHKALSWSAR